MEPLQRILFDDLEIGGWLPDETLHSLISRYHIRTGRPPRTHTAAVLFNNSAWRARHDLPTQLEAFSRSTFNSLGDATAIIRDRTVAPLFLPFLSEAAQHGLIGAMSRPGEGSPGSKLGLMRRGPATRHPLKFCPQCLADDRRTLQVAYWRRAHQCSGVWICLRHGHPLVVVEDPDARDWYLPDEAGRFAAANSTSYWPSATIDRVTLLAEFAVGVLHLPWLFRFRPDLVRSVARRCLQEKGFTTITGVVRLSVLATALIEFWSPLGRVGCVLPIAEDHRSTSRMLGKLLSGAAPGLHPLAWLVVFAFLYPNWRSFLGAYEQEGIDSTNKALIASPAIFVLQEPAAVQKFRQAMSTGQTLAGSARSAGITLRLARRWCAQYGIAVDRVLAAVPAHVRDEICRLYLEGSSREEIAVKLALDVSLVTYTLDSNPGIGLKRRSAQLSALKILHREKLEASLASYEGLPRAQLRQKCQAAYSWLLNHDRNWLESKLPSRRDTSRTPARLVESPQLTLLL